MKRMLVAAITGLAIAIPSLGTAAPDEARKQLKQSLSPVTVYKSPTCGCCGEWVKHMQASGFRVESREVADVTPIRHKYGVPDELSSCHTALVGGYTIEGHVPAADIKRLLRERAKATGLAVSGMVVGSPGMEQGPPQPYTTIVFDGRGGKVFERH